MIGESKQNIDENPIGERKTKKKELSVTGKLIPGKLKTGILRPGKMSLQKYHKTMY